MSSSHSNINQNQLGLSNSLNEISRQDHVGSTGKHNVASGSGGSQRVDAAQTYSTSASISTQADSNLASEQIRNYHLNRMENGSGSVGIKILKEEFGFNDQTAGKFMKPWGRGSLGDIEAELHEIAKTSYLVPRNKTLGMERNDPKSKKLTRLISARLAVKEAAKKDENNAVKREKPKNLNDILRGMDFRHLQAVLNDNTSLEHQSDIAKIEGILKQTFRFSDKRSQNFTKGLEAAHASLVLKELKEIAKTPKLIPRDKILGMESNRPKREKLWRLISQRLKTKQQLSKAGIGGNYDDKLRGRDLRELAVIAIAASSIIQQNASSRRSAHPALADAAFADPHQKLQGKTTLDELKNMQNHGLRIQRDMDAAKEILVQKFGLEREQAFTILETFPIEDMWQTLEGVQSVANKLQGVPRNNGKVDLNRLQGLITDEINNMAEKQLLSDETVLQGITLPSNFNGLKDK